MHSLTWPDDVLSALRWNHRAADMNDAEIERGGYKQRYAKRKLAEAELKQKSKLAQFLVFHTHMISLSKSLKLLVFRQEHYFGPKHLTCL